MKVSSTGHSESRYRGGMSLNAMLTMLTVVAALASASIGTLSLWAEDRSAGAASEAFVAKDVTADILPPPLYLIEMRLLLSQVVEGSMPAGDARKNFERLKTEYLERVAYWRAHPPHGLEVSLLGAQHEAAQKFIATASQVIDSVGGGQSDTAKSALVAAHTQYLEHRKGVDATVLQSMAFAEKSIASYQSTVSAMVWVQAILLLLSTIGLVVFGLWIRRAVLAAVGGEPALAASLARSVAQGDLSTRIPVAPGDQTSIVSALGHMCDALADVVSQVRRNSDSIATGSREIAQGNADLSQRTEEQASSLEETASSMEELTSTVKQNAENARQANQLAVGASDVAVKGGDVVKQVVTTMNGISESSKKIADIIGTIDGIAFQTNILALNAAVEAARAGEQGRGFAVVATEVRNLAQRSAAAAKEIKELITDSVSKVDAGSQLVDDAGRTMDEIVTSVKRVTDIMGEITAASQEQSSGIEQVNQAITQMDEVTQQNAALVEEAAAAAESMQEQAQNLAQAVSVFRLEAGADHGAEFVDLRPKAAVRELRPTRHADPQAWDSVNSANCAPGRARTGTDHHGQAM